jgi:hypothetical protein
MSLFDGIAWVYWLVGTLGVAGTIAALWFAPAITGQVLWKLASFLFTTRIGNIILAAAIAFMVADINRSQRDAADYAEKTAAATAAFEEARKQRDIEITEETRAAVMAELARARLTEAQLNSDVKEFSDALPPAPPVNGTSDFRVGDASCRLRAIAGYAGCGPEAAAGRVPQARPEGARSRLPDWAQYRLPEIISRGPREPARSQ